jgi:DNA-binding Lrp family transcriptional regulator
VQSSVATARDTNTKTAELVNLISEIGPDIPEISRRLGQFKESVRYRYKEKVLNRGFSVQAAVNYEKLGLRRVVLLVDFAPAYNSYAHSILTAMNELCYLVYFERRMFRGDFIVEASVPSELVDTYSNFMLKLKERGLFRSVEVIPFEWYRVVPMRAESYDFDTGRWEFDWSSPLKPSDAADYRPTEKVKLDNFDLLIIEELQTDATRSFVEIAEKLKTNYKKLAWHYKMHVLERGMIRGYFLRWMETTYSTVLEKALNRKHRYQHLAVLATDLSEVERMNLMGRLHSVPFLWNEMGGTDAYCANLYFPTENITEAYQFLTAAIAYSKDKVSVMALDQTEALSFTVTPQLFDERKHAWTLDEQALLPRFDRLIEKIKEIGGAA